MEKAQLHQLIREVIEREMAAFRGDPPQLPPASAAPPAGLAPDCPAPACPVPAATAPAETLESGFREIRLNERVLTAGDLEQVEPHSTIVVPLGAIISPLVRDVIQEKKIRLKFENELGRPSVAIGSDHRGFRLKQTIKSLLVEWGYPFFDFGAHSEEAVDYPEIAHKVAKAVAERHHEVGVIIDGAGIGSCMAANKVPGVRAAFCPNAATARNSREHNYANVLTLGATPGSAEEVRQILKTWLETPYGEQRHGRRVQLIHEIEKKYCKE